jgi:peptidoglycan/xylan/chitin deacetylase (PgdA/CDA1 family)
MEKQTWQWPNEAEGAVSLTYDDGNENNLDQAIPDLDAAGFTGTFYLTIGREEVQRRAHDWRSAHETGHEIGNHTWHHNCRADLFGGQCPDWIKKPLEEYSMAEMAAEVEQAAAWLDNHIGPDLDRSFAYPCGNTCLGNPPVQEAYLRAVRARHRFARGWSDSAGVNDPRHVNLMLIECFAFAENALENLQGAVRQGLAEGGWVCLGFHGIGGPSHITERHVHQHLLEFLKHQRLWVAPVRDVARYIEDCRAAKLHYE